MPAYGHDGVDFPKGIRLGIGRTDLADGVVAAEEQRTSSPDSDRRVDLREVAPKMGSSENLPKIVRLRGTKQTSRPSFQLGSPVSQ